MIINNKIRVILYGFAGVILYIVGNLLVSLLSGNPIINSIIANSIAIAILIFWMVKHPANWTVNDKKLSVTLVLITLIVTWITSQAFAIYLQSIINSETFSNINDVIQKTPGYLLILSSIIIAPITEELFMRGFLQSLLLRIISPAGAIIFSTLVFAGMHGNPIQMVIALPLGMICGLIYYQTKNIIWAIVAHMAYNLASLFVPKTIILTIANNPAIAIILFVATIGYLILWLTRLPSNALNIVSND